MTVAALCNHFSKAGVGARSAIQPRRLSFTQRLSPATPAMAAQRRRASIVAFKDERREGEVLPKQQGDLAEKVQEVIAPAGIESGPGLGGGFETGPLVPAFTRRRERVVGRIAMLGFAAGLIGELLTGYGPVTQLSIETGITPTWIYTFIATIIAWTSFGASPGSPTWNPENQRDISTRRNPALYQPRKAIIKSELVLGRMAMIGFLGAVAMEKVWGGQSPLAHVGLIQPGVSLLQGPGWVIATVCAFVLGGTGLLSMFANKERDNDMW